MDGAIPGSSSESIRQLTARFQVGAFGGGGTSAQSGQALHAGLFEQFLSLPAPLTFQPQTPVNIETADSQPTDDPPPTERSDETAEGSLAENQAPTAEEEAERGAVEDQVAILSATTTTAVAPESLSADDAALHPNQNTQSIDDSLTTAQAEDQNAGAEQPLSAESPHGQQARSDVAEEAARKVAAEEPLARADTTPTTLDAQDQQHRPEATDATQSPQVAENMDEKLFADESLDKAATKVDEDNPLRPVALENSAAAADADPQGRQRGEGRAKWYERSSQPASGAQAADEKQAARESSIPQEVAQAELSEPTTRAPLPSEGPTGRNPSLPPPVENSVPSAAVGSGAAVVESVAATIASGNLTSNLGGEAGGGEPNASTKGGELSNAVSKTSSADAKTTSPATQRADQLTQAERARLVQRIARSFARLGSAGGPINIKLHPPQLGSLNVQVRMEGRTMTAKLSTETSAARDVILESLPVLRGRLAEQGFEIASFQVEVADNNADAANNNQQSWTGQSGSEQQSSGRQVDFRRVAALQRQQTAGVGSVSQTSVPRELAWQTLTGMDMQA